MHFNGQPLYVSMDRRNEVIFTFEIVSLVDFKRWTSIDAYSISSKFIPRWYTPQFLCMLFCYYRKSLKVFIRIRATEEAHSFNHLHSIRIVPQCPYIHFICEDKNDLDLLGFLLMFLNIISYCLSTIMWNTTALFIRSSSS